jgi:hypothetical protein
MVAEHHKVGFDVACQEWRLAASDSREEDLRYHLAMCSWRVRARDVQGPESVIRTVLKRLVIRGTWFGVAR